MTKLDLARTLITGGGGIIGAHIRWGLRLSRTDLDVRDIAAVRRVVCAQKPEAMVHLASVNLRHCHEDPVRAIAVNIRGTLHVARVAAELGVPMVFLSTGAVFGGELGRVFAVSDAPDPRNVYGETKAAGEALVRALVSEHLIVRTGWVFGNFMPGKARFVETIVERAERNETLTASPDQMGSPTYIKDLVSELGRLMQARQWGTHHVVNGGGGATALDLVTHIVRATGSASEVQPKPAAAFNPPGLERSPSETLAPSGGLRPWRDALDAYLAERGRLREPECFE